VNSSYTGLAREDWAAAADGLLLALRPFASPDHARIGLPGVPSRYGQASDALEAFARSFLLAAIRLRGEDGADPLGLAGWYAEGLRAGTDPGSPHAWPLPGALPQARVEACSIALGLHLTRPWIWDRLPPAGQERIVAWLGTAAGRPYVQNNWVWFQIVTQTFLRSAGGPWSAADIDSALALHESLYRGGGWYSDGHARSYDHYVGWALHVYPLLWADMAGPWCPAELRERWRERLSRFLGDAVLLVGGDGSPLLQGRSLVYRFTAAAPFWMGAITGATTLPPGLIRRVCGGMLGHFHGHGVPAENGLLTLGWHREWPAMKQDYSGPGSPYWAAKGMLGLLLPADHPVWTAPEEPLPVERADTGAAFAAPGWLVSGSRADGIVRVVNHGTDHAEPGARRSDAPLYARLGYSTATLPPLGAAAVASPPDNAVTILDDTGIAAHRSGFEALYCEFAGGTGLGASRSVLHWVAIEEDTSPEHAHARSGTVRDGPVLTVASALRGAVEVRAARIDSPCTGNLELSGWPVASAEPLAAEPLAAGPAEGAGPSARVSSGRLTSSVTSLAGFTTASVRQADGSSPLGDHVAIPVLRGPARAGQVYLAAVVLTGGYDAPALPSVTVRPDLVTIRWADGTESRLPLPRERSARELPDLGG
jgi:hypothetical protein